MKNKIIKNKFEFIGFILTIKILLVLPFRFGEILLKNLIYSLGIFLGIRKNVIISQLKKSFPNYTEKKIKEIYKKIWKNFAITTTEFYLVKPERIFKNIKYNNLNYLEDAISYNKGVIITSAHFSNWETAALWLTKKKYKVSVVIKKLRNDYVNNYTNNVREKRGIEIIYMKQALRPMLKALKNNKILCLLIDQAAGKNGYQLNFLNQKASVHIGAAKIALKTNSPIIFAVSIRNKNGSYTLDFNKPIYPEKLKESQKNTKYITTIINNKLENYITKYPELWFWHHKRWKNAEKAKIWED